MTPSPSYTEKSTPKKIPDSSYAAQADDITEDLKSATEGVAGMARHLKEDAVKVTNTVVREAQERLEDVKADAGDYIKSLEENIKSHPRESLAIAFAAGVALTLLLSRR